MAAINLEVSVSISGFALILFLSYRTIIIRVFFIRTGCLNYFAMGKSFGKCVSPSAMNGFAVIELTFATDI